MSAPPTPTPTIIAVVLVDDASRLGPVVEQIKTQGLAPASVVAAGKAPSIQEAAEELGLRWVPEAAALRDDLDAATTHVWFIHDDVRLRPDTLGALHSELERVEASVAGSKLLGADGRELESIGGLTDAFAHPVSVLEDGELDLGQYDVIRDVAYLPSASLLVRRDLFRGLGGIDRMLAPEAAGIDFAQRARLAGGRVVIVPSSEVIHDGACREGVPQWRESAGQLRAVLKSYSMISLLWAIPMMAIIGLLASLGSLVTGRFGQALDVVKTWAWNVKNAGSLFKGRTQARVSRAVGDEELFRYQVRGSAALTDLWDDIVDALRAPLSQSEAVLEWAEERSTGRSAAVAATLIAAWFVAVRSLIFDGLPTVGWVIPLDADWRGVLASYAGGWNPVGFGADGPPHPSAAVLAYATRFLGDSAAVTVTALAAGLGLIGAYRLLRSLGTSQWQAVVGAVIGIFGAATQTLGADGNWPGLLALGAVPWALIGVVRPFPSGWRARVTSLARAGVAAFLMTAMVPGSVVLPVVVGVLAALFGLGWTALPRGVVVSLLAIPAVGSWGVWNSIDSVTAAGSAPEWVVPLFVSAGLLVAWLSSLGGDTWKLGAVGGVLLGTGATLARGFLPGRELATAGLILLAAGLMLIGAAVSSRLSGAQGFVQRTGALVAIAALVVTLVPTGSIAVTGSMGLGETTSTADRLRYLVARDRDAGERVLISSDDLLGDAGEWRGLQMRVLDPRADFADAWRGRDGVMETNLRADLDTLIAAPGLRAGDLFETYGLGWIITTPDSALATALRGRLDVIELTFADTSVFEYVETAPPAEAITGPWQYDGTTWVGPASTAVTLRINPTSRFVAEDGVYKGSSGAVATSPDPVLARAARASLITLLVLGALSLIPRRRT